MKIFTPDISGWETADAQEIIKVNKTFIFSLSCILLDPANSS